MLSKNLKIRQQNLEQMVCYWKQQEKEHPRLLVAMVLVISMQFL